MKLWRMLEPFDTTYAEAWLRSPARLVKPATCDYCGRDAEYEDPRPLVLEWEPGSDVVGDFVWPDGSRVAVQRRAFDIISSHFAGIEAGAVEMVQDPKLRRPTRKTKQTKPRVWLPYEGPDLVELWVQHAVPLAPGSVKEISSHCRKCGRALWNWSGVEVKEHRWDQEQKRLVPRYTPRDPNRGLRIAASDVAANPIFRAIESPAAIFCTDQVKALIEGEQLTNIDFLDYGELIYFGSL